MTAAWLPLFAVLAVAPPQGSGHEAGPMPRRVVVRESGLHPFTLTAQDGRSVTLAELRGKVWIASFVVVVCPDGKCPQVTATVKRLQQQFSNRPDVLLVTFVVSTGHDPEALQQLAEKNEADPKRWLFLHGSEEEIDALLRSFKLRGPKDSTSDDKHSQKLIVVDRHGEVRGYYDGMEDSRIDPEGHLDESLAKLKKKVDEVRLEGRSVFPDVNAALNAVAATLILAGWLAIRARVVRLHVICMLAALLTSATFLACYLYYHLVIMGGVPTKFSYRAPDAASWVAILYSCILTTHTILAVFATPMAVVSAYLGLRDRLSGHVRLARWTMPIWLYVSVTGVVVYWMLYRLY